MSSAAHRRQSCQTDKNDDTTDLPLAYLAKISGLYDSLQSTQTHRQIDRQLLAILCFDLANHGIL